MESRAKEYLGLVCNLYIGALLCVLPLYMKERYWQLGDGKYLFFRNVSLFCFGVWGVICVVTCLKHIIRRKKFPTGISISDVAVIVYGGVNIVSYWNTAYSSTAWYGYEQWYMGLLSQLLFVGIYFFVSRHYDGSVYGLWAGMGSLFLLSLYGVIQRLDIDPLGLFRGYQPKDWEYTHMLSSIGNINWLCGYLSVLLPLAITGFMIARKNVSIVCLYVVSYMGILLLCVQGSSGGLLILGIGVITMFFISLTNHLFFRKILLLGIGVGFTMPFLSFLCKRNEWIAFPVDDLSCRKLISFPGWLPIALGLVIVYFLSYKTNLTKMKTIAAWIGGGLLTVACTLIGIQFLNTTSLDYTFGTGRGGLWTMAIKSFQMGDLRQKLFGVGPDCYGEHIYRTFQVQEYVVLDGRFQNAIFTNAHNEWLNQLVNIGLLGVISYLFLFASMLYSYGKVYKNNQKFLLGILVTLVYGIYSIVSFQHVLNAPFLFLAWGLCENQRRTTLPEQIDGSYYEVDKV